ncbi:hypothetical protein Rhe02_53200 [Rhizocola hellebori]|uniref:Uncharacterized protein n=1 Tax=Rhizocola hellebori TaxID=1392758 RepID=A0A8J3QCM8_9ACTN|nr:hypothetical protein [Rhizocola hellebori]GIH07253.1 hypothetical protein Rhe02_53200 [Rhizocola hellebori]
MPYVVALALTLAIEVPVYVVALRFRSAWALAVAVNLVTHPAVWLLLAGGASIGYFMLVELAAWMVEFGLLWAVLRRSSSILFAAAVLANSLSCLAGLLLA